MQNAKKILIPGIIMILGIALLIFNACTPPDITSGLDMSNTGKPEINIVEETTDILSGQTYTFEAITVKERGTPVTFAIQNTGTGTLYLNSNTKIALSGDDAADFRIDHSALSGQITGQSSSLFTIEFMPVTPGIKKARITIDNNDLDENPYVVNLTGEALDLLSDIRITGFNGDDGTDDIIHDYHEIYLGEEKPNTFVIENKGAGTLNISQLYTMGEDSNHFKINQSDLIKNIEANSRTWFQVTFSPQTDGQKSATLFIVSDDPDEKVTRVILKGNAIFTEPELVIEGTNGKNEEGNPTYTFEDTISGESREQTFIIRNNGELNLDITAVRIAGDNQTDFILDSSLLSSTILPGRSAHFTVKFNPDSPGAKTAILSIVTNDADNNLSIIELSGQCTNRLPAIEVLTTDTSGDVSLTYPVTSADSTKQKTLTIANRGTGELTITGIHISGEAENAFAVDTSYFDFSLAPGQTSFITVMFKPLTSGVKRAVLSVASNDPIVQNLTVDLEGICVVDQPALVLDGLNLLDETGDIKVHDFGRVVIGEDIKQTVIIKNEGKGTLEVSGMNLSGEGRKNFLLDTALLSRTIKPGGTAYFTLSYQPLTESLHEADLILTSNSIEPITRIRLRGEGFSKNPVFKLLGTENNSYDYGEITVGESIERTFIIFNQGEGDLAITSIDFKNNYNPAFIVDSTDMVEVIKPGRSGYFTVVFKPNAGGNEATELIIRTNDAANREVTLNLAGSARILTPELMVIDLSNDLTGDPQAIEITTTAVGRQKIRPFTVMNTGEVNLILSNISLQGDNDVFSLDFTGYSSVIVPGASTTINVRFKPDAAASYATKLLITSNDATNNPVMIPIRAESILLTPDIEVTGIDETVIQPAGTYDRFSEILADTTDTHTLRIRNTGNADLKISGIYISGGTGKDSFELDATTIKEIVKPDEFTICNLSFTPTSAGLKSAALTILTNCPDESTKTFTFTVQGTGIKSEPNIMVTPEGTATDLFNGSFDLGLVDYASGTLEKQFIIKNTGSKELEITGINLSGNEYYSLNVSNVPSSLRPDQTAAFTVKFDPKSSTGIKVTKVTINNNSFEKNPFSFDVTANAGNPGIVVFDDITLTTPVNTSHDMGLVNYQGQSYLEHTFYIENSGNAPLRITEVGLSDNPNSLFTVNTSGTSLNSDIVPDGTTSFSVRFTPGALTGSQSASLMVKSNAGNTSFSLAADAGTPGIKVCSDVALQDVIGNTFDMGKISYDVQPYLSKTVFVENTGTSPLVITTISVSDVDNYFTIDTSLTDLSLSPGANTSFSIKFDPRSQTGSFTTDLTIANNAGNKLIAVRADAGSPDIAITSDDAGTQPVGDSFDMGLVDYGTGSKITKTMYIKNTGSAALTIEDITVLDQTGAFGVDKSLTTLNLSPDAITSFTVTFNATGLNGIKGTTLTVKNSASDKSITLAADAGTPVLGLFSDTDCTIKIPATFDMGSVDYNAGGTISKAVYVKNTGTAPLTITDISLVDAKFSIDATQTTMTLGPEAKSSFVVTFDPKGSTGSQIASFAIASTAGDKDVTCTADAGTPTLKLYSDAGLSTEIGSTYDMGSVDYNAGGTISKTVQVKNTGTAPLTITDISLVDDKFSINATQTTMTLNPDAKSSFVVSFDPKGSTGSQLASFSITSNAGDKNVTCSADAGTPALKAYSNSGLTTEIGSTYDMGILNFPTQTSVTKTHYLKNTGTAPVTVTSISVTDVNGNFTVNTGSTTMTINPGKSTSYSVKFDSKSTPGAKSTTLTIQSNVASKSFTISADGGTLTIIDDFETGNLSRMPWTSNPAGPPPLVTTSQKQTGNYSVSISSTSGDSTDLSLKIEVLETAEISFYWKETSASHPGAVNFRVNASTIAILNYQSDGNWQNVKHTLNPGTYTLVWGCGGQGGNFGGYIDNIRVLSGSIVPIND